jgi:DNA-binding GntR family transcriptional regulator
MSTPSQSSESTWSPEGGDHIRVDSVVDLAYARIRAVVLGDELAPGTKLRQVELAEQLGISRTPVREALLRLSAEGLVEPLANRGFRVADLGLDAVLQRLEVRAMLEPRIAGLAAERRTERDLEKLNAAIVREEKAASGIEAHDASREFHIELARAAHNDELLRVLESLWLVEVGRRLLSRRWAIPDWPAEDIEDHRAIMQAVAEQRVKDAERLAAEHVSGAVYHWNADH